MSLWDILPVEIQDIILEKSYDIQREEFLVHNGKKHQKRKKKQGKGLLTPELIRYIMSSTDAIEMIYWAFPLELAELELLIDPPPRLMEYEIYDYVDFYDKFLTKAINYIENPNNKNQWICPSDDHWLHMYTELVEFHRKYKHVNVLDEDGGKPSLFIWLEYQKDTDTQLSREKRYSLRSLGVRLPKIKNYSSPSE